MEGVAVGARLRGVTDPRDYYRSCTGAKGSLKPGLQTGGFSPQFVVVKPSGSSEKVDAILRSFPLFQTKQKLHVFMHTFFLGFFV
jgi:hypothetical protein